MSFVNIWTHVVWSTKYRLPYLIKDIRTKLIYHIIENADIKGYHINFINGYNDHLHLLISINPTQTISEIVHQIKGESSRWINEKKLTDMKFEWQSEYYAVSVSAKEVDELRKYIKYQEEHHKNISFDDEIIELIKWNNIISTGFKPSANE